MQKIKQYGESFLTWLKQVGVAFKCLFILVMTCFLLEAAGMAMTQTFAYDLLYVVEGFEYWRLFTSGLSTYPVNIFAVLLLLICLWSLYTNVSSLV